MTFVCAHYKQPLKTMNSYDKNLQFAHLPKGNLLEWNSAGMFSNDVWLEKSAFKSIAEILTKLSRGYFVRNTLW